MALTPVVQNWFELRRRAKGRVVNSARLGVHPIRRMHRLEPHAIGLIERRDTPSVSHARSWPHEAILIQIIIPRSCEPTNPGIHLS